MVVTAMAALAQVELKIKRERVLDTESRRRAAGARRSTTGDRGQLSAQPSAAERRRRAGGGLVGNLGISRATPYLRLPESKPSATELPEAEEGAGPPGLHYLTVLNKRLLLRHNANACRVVDLLLGHEPLRSTLHTVCLKTSSPTRHVKAGSSSH